MAEQPARLRERRSQLTRQEVLDAARRLFAERGYARTSMRDIAVAAGVSPQTVYDAVGSKAELVARLNDLVDTEAGVGDLVRSMAESRDAAYVAATSARVTRAILESCGDVLRTLASAAADEPELRRVLEEGHRRHVAGARSVVDRLRELRAVRAGVSADQLTQELAAVSDFRVALVLRDGYGWSFDRIEEWIEGASRRVLLDG